MFFFKNILCHNVGYESSRGLGTNWSKVGTKRLSLGTNHLGTKDPWVRNNWIPFFMTGSTVLHYTRAPLSHLSLWKHNFLCGISFLKWTLLVHQSSWFPGSQTELFITCVVFPVLCNNNYYCILFDFSILCSVSW